MTKISIPDIAQMRTLAGQMAGMAARPSFERAAGDIPEGSTVFLDLAEVTILTSSYFLASLWAVFWDSSFAKERDLYPVLYNVPSDSVRDTEIVFEAKGVPAIFAHGPEDRLGIRLFNLDETGRATLKVVDESGETTAAELHERDRTIGKTGWSNRLALLHDQRILRRHKVGRQLVYSPCWR